MRTGGEKRQKVRPGAGSLARLPAGRRTKYAVVAVWLVVLVAIGPLAGKFEDARRTIRRTISRRRRVGPELDRLDGFLDDEADAIAVFHRDGGLTLGTAPRSRRCAPGSTSAAPAINASDPEQWPRPARRGSRATARPRADDADHRLRKRPGDAEDLLTDTPEEIKEEARLAAVGPSGARSTAPPGSAPTRSRSSTTSTARC